MKRKKKEIKKAFTDRAFPVIRPYSLPSLSLELTKQTPFRRKWSVISNLVMSNESIQTSFGSLTRRPREAVPQDDHQSLNIYRLKKKKRCHSQRSIWEVHGWVSDNPTEINYWLCWPILLMGKSKCIKFIGPLPLACEWWELNACLLVSHQRSFFSHRDPIQL